MLFSHLFSTDVNECESNPTSNLGPCTNAAWCNNTPGAFTCECLDGWTGPTCARDVDDCIGQCKNGATCIDLVNDYHCACAAGFTGMKPSAMFSLNFFIKIKFLNSYLLKTGRDCETDIDECVASPCRNGGECVDMIAKFKCICPVGYSGTLCEVRNVFLFP